MRLRGGVVSEEVLDKKLHVATNYLDHLAQKFKLDFDLLEFGDQIASGGFSDVYTGLYRGVEPAVEVAIKKLRIDVIDPDQYFLDLEREVELLSSLSHPCILQFVGCCVWPSYYIVTELMEGGDWDKALRKRDLVLPWSLR
jgi:serine/threonine protein kinase